MTATPTAPPRLRTGVVIDCTDRERIVATVDVHGQLCAVTTPTLRRELECLVDDGVTDVHIDLRDLRLCTSEGLDLLDQVHDRLQRDHDGEVVLHDPRGVVERVLDAVSAADPSFSPLLADAGDAPDVPTERPGDSSD